MREGNCGVLPVLEDGVLVGILSMNDIILVAAGRGPVRFADVVEALQAICARPTSQMIAA